MDTFRPIEHGLSSRVSDLHIHIHIHIHIYVYTYPPALSLSLSFLYLQLRIAEESDAKLRTDPSFGPQAMANIAWAYATLDCHVPWLFRRLASTAIPTLRFFAPQELSSMAIAYGRVLNLHMEFMAALGDECVRPGRLETFSTQAVANIMWGCATLRYYHPRLLDAVS